MSTPTTQGVPKMLSKDPRYKQIQMENQYNMSIKFFTEYEYEYIRKKNSPNRNIEYIKI